MYLTVWIQNSHLTSKVFLHHLMSCKNVSLCSVSGAQPALHFGGVAIFMKFHSMTPSCFFSRGTTFSQTVTESSLRSISKNENFSVLIKNFSSCFSKFLKRGGEPAASVNTGYGPHQNFRYSS